MPRGRVAYDLTGQRYGRLTAQHRAERAKNGNIMWLCLCDCGNTALVTAHCLRSGHTQSCGCYQKERAGDSNRKHGRTKSRLHNEWLSMKARCYNKNNKRYNRYGERGIEVCQEWLDSFEAFRDWALANGYQDDLTLDRRDNDGSYNPDNCRWVTLKEQQNNRSTNYVVEYNGRKQTVTQWAEELGMSYRCLYSRLRRGWDTERAFTAPVRGTKELGL